MKKIHRYSREGGELQDRRIIDALRRKPGSKRDIAALLGVTPGGAYLRLLKLHKEKRIRVVDHVPNVSGGALSIYGAGGGPDKEYVPKRAIKPCQNDRVQELIDAILKLLEKAHTVAQLAAKLHKSESVIRTRLRMLRTPENRRVRICNWIQHGERNGWCPVYSKSRFPDAPRPKRLTDKEYHDKARADPEKRERERRRQRERDQLRRLQKKPAAWHSVLMVKS